MAYEAASKYMNEANSIQNSWRMVAYVRDEDSGVFRLSLTSSARTQYTYAPMAIQLACYFSGPTSKCKQGARSSWVPSGVTTNAAGR